MAYMNSIPGIPVIYYGSEFGMTGATDPDNRRMMRFDNELSKYEEETKREVSYIINLRKAHPALRYGDFYTLIADENIYAYIRSDMNERVLVVLNKSSDQQIFSPQLLEFYSSKKLIDQQSNKEFSLKSSAVITLPQWGWKIFIIE